MKARRLRSVTGAVLLLVLASSVRAAKAQAASDALAIIEIGECRLGPHAVTGSFRLVGALGPEDRSMLESGMELTFVHRLTVVRRRALFFDKVLARRTITVSAEQDTLTKQYTLRRRVGDQPEETSRGESPAEAERWLSEVSRFEIPLAPAGERGVLELRVRSEYRRIYAAYLFPWSLSALGDKVCR